MVMLRPVLLVGLGMAAIFALITLYTHSQLEIGSRISLGHYFSNRFIKNRFMIRADPDLHTTGSVDHPTLPVIPIPRVQPKPRGAEKDSQELGFLHRDNKYYVGPDAPRNLGTPPKCPHGQLLTYWRSPTTEDKEFTHPFSGADDKVGVKYLTFEPDVGGWNNIRMQMEIVLVLAMTTGRTLVLPPEQHMYLLLAGKENQKSHSFADFFDFAVIGERVKVVSMETFLEREGISGHLKRLDNVTLERVVEYPPENRTVFDNTKRSEKLLIWGYLRSVGASLGVKGGFKHFLTLPFGPEGTYHLSQDQRDRIDERRRLFAAERAQRLYDSSLQAEKLIHIVSRPEINDRLLLHYYTFIFFENESVERLVHRFVRDYIHYVDSIVCKAALIVNLLFKEGMGHGFSTFHVRRYSIYSIFIRACFILD